MKDLRKIFTDGDEANHPGWKLDKKTYTVEDVAQKLKQFVFDELYTDSFKDSPLPKPDLGFIVVGYSANAAMADEFMIEIKGGSCTGPRPVRNRDQIGMIWGGNAEALNRLVVGVGVGLPQVLGSMFRLSPEQILPVVETIKGNLQLPLVVPAMPLQDAIELAEFLVDLTIKFSRFMPGAPTVGGPVEIAAISKHEGFRWIKRKYYFNRKLNPEEIFSRLYEPAGKESQIQPD
jgi:hypothetical protein